MATTNNKCKKCGCEDKFLTSPAPCPTPIGCPEPEPCSEVLDSQCVIYTGENIICNDDVLVTTNDSVAEALQDIVNYFCNNTGGGNTTIVQAGVNTTVTSSTVGTTTTYTVNARCPMDVQISLGGGIRTIQANVTGGTAPYTYQWLMADCINSVNTSMWVLSSTPNPAVVLPSLNNAIVNKFQACATVNGGSFGLAKVIVTDANGCIAKDTFLLIDIACA